jgi:glycosyltransferase involved in cell wall biosynthesis
VTDIYLSIVIPTYNESDNIKHTLDAIYEYLGNQNYSYEVILCDDGSYDLTTKIAKESFGKKSNFQILSLPHKGKGSAVKSGMVTAQGRYRFMCDADLAMPFDQIERFLKEMTNDCDIAIGSRELTDSKIFGEPMLRYFAGRVFNLFVKFVAIRKYQDTQCGFKCFSSEAGDKIFPLVRTNGWAFDVEVLLLADKYGFSVSQVPIDWHHGEDSKVDLRSAALQMIRDIFLTRVRLLMFYRK